MDIFLNGYGTQLRKKENRFVIEYDGEMRECASRDVSQIMFSDAGSITTGAMKLAAENDVDIVVVSRSGEPVCRIVPCTLSGTPQTRHAQLVCAKGPEGFCLVTSILRAKLQNMAYLLKALGHNRNDEKIGGRADQIIRIAEGFPAEGTLSDASMCLRAMEGYGSRIYFEALAYVLAPELYLGHRSRRPAEDAFNAYLNYGYGILTNEVSRAVTLAGLDTNMGYFHAERAGKHPFVYDMIEQFRQPVIDREIITLAVRGRMKPSDVDQKGYLTSDGRRRAASAVLHRLNAPVRYRNRETTFRDEIRDSLKMTARYLRGDGTFTPFVYHWND
ncbi:MAG TPA: CRISPR-associated endonuclease Cas1 [Methanoculleus sp.]|nr:CRISPR-associated endonuclease Cas1 [Methanoculleus sp.]